MVQIYRSLLTFFSSLSSSRYFKVPDSTQQQKKTYHKAIKQSQTVYEQSPNQLVGHHVPTATDQGTEPKSGPKVTHFQMLVSRGGLGAGKTRSQQTDIQEPFTPVGYLLFNSTLTFVQLTRRCGSVYLGVVVLRVCEICYVYEGYVGFAVVVYAMVLFEMSGVFIY